MLDQFAGAFIDADTVTVLPIYAASEAAHSRSHGGAAGGQDRGPRVTFAPDFAAALESIAAKAHEGDLVLTLGAGSVSQLALQIVAALETVEVR